MSSRDLTTFVNKGLFNNDPSYELPKLNRKFYTSKKTNQTYCTVRYDKSSLTTDDYNSIGLFRSVVFNLSNNKVLAFAPPKSVKLNSADFTDDWENDNIQVEEFVDGTMINVFWDSTIGEGGDWQIASRSCVEANVGFYLHTGSKTFRHMFLEACNEVKLEFDYLNKKSVDDHQLSYSFVLQHPDNRIVVPYQKPNLVLVETYKIKQTDGTNHLEISVYNDDSLKQLLQEKTTISFPKIYDNNISFNSTQSFIDSYASKNTPYHVQGVVFKNLTKHIRAKVRNPIYEEVRRLKGNQPKKQYRYLTLRQQNKVSSYLHMFPEDKNCFSIFRNQLHAFTKGLYQNYVNCYIKKQKPLKEFPYQFRTHMFHIHRKYLDEFITDKKSIQLGTVIEYVNTLHPSQQMFALNYHMRKRNMDSVDTSCLQESDA